MPSIIEGYNYDIFISYRQKDNKHDGWVTEFVNNLKGELESTFKEEISVYFDINPHDGLLETHDVDESLKEKLKCLIFIPIISRTYCDPKSFAWEHEFKAFIEQASKDQYGLKVRLPGGNVASRVLPAQIHDLDPEDKKLIEDELGGFIRGVEFIYKEPGINKPLKPDDDEKKNLNKTKYSYQVNKVANAVKEIINGLEHPGESNPPERAKTIDDKPLFKSRRSTRIITGTLLLVILIIAGYFLVFKMSGSKQDLEKSIAVLPFDYTSAEDDSRLASSLVREIINNLSAIKELNVRPKTSVDIYKPSSRPSVPQIRKELNVNYVVEGDLQRAGDKIRLYIQLINALKNRQIWNQPYEFEVTNTTEIFTTLSKISKQIAEELKAEISPEEQQIVERISTTNFEAFNHYQNAGELWSKYPTASSISINPEFVNNAMKAEALLRKSIRKDPGFSEAYSALVLNLIVLNFSVYMYTTNFLDSARFFNDLALKYNPRNSEAYYASSIIYLVKGDYNNAFEELDKAIKYKPNYWQAYDLRVQHFFLRTPHYMDYIKALEDEYKAININNGKDLPELLTNLGNIYSFSGFEEKRLELVNHAFDLSGDSIAWLTQLSDYYYQIGDFEKSVEKDNMILKIDSTNMEAIQRIGQASMWMKKYEESLKYLTIVIDYYKSTGRMIEAMMHRFGFIYWVNGQKEEGKYWLNKQKEYCESSIGNNNAYAVSLSAQYDLAGIYAFLGDKENAYKYLRIVETIPVFPNWWLTLIKVDPLFDSIRGEDEFQRILQSLESKNQAEHERVRKWIEKNNML